jgi:hypothetical protein
MGWSNKGPLTEFRKLFTKLNPERQQRLINLNMIHLGFYIKMNIFWKKCTASNLLLRKMQKFSTVFDFLESMKTDVVLSQRILGCLPHQIHQIYLAERESA